MKIITDYVFTFSKDNKAVEKVSLGEIIKFKTLDCFCNQIKSEDEIIGEIDFSRANPATGPVYVDGAEEGDILVVEILDIETENQGLMATIPDLGPLANLVEMRTKMLDIVDGYIHFNDIKFKQSNMIGVIGTAPKGEDVPCGMWGPHGGNMDNKLITAGTTIYLPVNIDGALLQIGDLHASMGDGEICGTGVEVSGEVTVKVDLIKNKKINRPIHETEDKWYVIASAETYDEALQLAVKDLKDLIEDAYGWDATDIYMYLSAQGDVEIAQGVKPSPGDMVVRVGIPKDKTRPLLNK